MNIVRLVAVGVIGLLGISVAIADEKEYPKLIVGKWEVSKADPGTVPDGTVIEFTKDGKIKFTGKKDGQDVMFEGTYKLEKNTFVMTINRDGEERKQTVSITKLSGTELTVKDERDKVVEMKKKK